MCELEEVETAEEIPVLFTDEMDILEDRLTDIVLAAGLPEEQTNAILRLINDALEEHHYDLLEVVEDMLAEDDEEETE